MTASGEFVPAQVALERRYRRLLWAYPADYRRVHGEEILTMLMDSAEPGRRRPAGADTIDVLRGAVRQRFRLPVGRSAVLAAVLAALVLGAVQAGVSSWLVWQTAADLPSDAAARRMAETVAGAPLIAPDVQRPAGLRQTPWEVNVANPDEQRFANWTTEAAQARLQADGWTLGPVEGYTVASYGGNKLAPRPGITRTGPDEIHQTFQATRDGHVLHVHANAVLAPGAAGSGLLTTVSLMPPRWEPGAMLLGWLIGATIGWLLTAWAGYRLRGRTLARRMAALALGLTALWSAVAPVADFYLRWGSFALTDPVDRGIDPTYGSVVDHLDQVGVTLAIAAAILALAAAGRRRPAAGRRPAGGPAATTA
ncbi:hypothetical protein [Actinoplanes sp. M2I2]|uniref:hypothetical protein n=1 Tax=Actinoplanes sp. M2I2 TaxID=1734444 RepID=UPI002021F059|nr:hypothetical protein [Actinoplanes sp. M2I2]